MSQAAFAAPLPPPPPCKSSIPATIEHNKKSASVIHLSNDECSWATEHSEIRKACFLGRVCQYTMPKKCQYYTIPSLLQIGPTCGLTALSMLLSEKPTATELLQEAITLMYTNNGEMFSAQNLYELTQKHLNAVGSCQLINEELNSCTVKEHLSAGGFLLVPYDADVNHAPCQKSGHRAHWALIVGYLVDDLDEFYVFARHGKTRNLAVWSLTALSESNANLTEFAQPKAHPDYTFLLPPGGIAGAQGLRKRSILVQGLSHEIVKVR